MHLPPRRGSGAPAVYFACTQCALIPEIGAGAAPLHNVPSLLRCVPTFMNAKSATYSGDEGLSAVPGGWDASLDASIQPKQNPERRYA